mgnify:CR=1 FL=1
MTVILFAFAVLLYSVSLFLLISFFYKNLSTYFTDNNKNSFFGNIALVLQYGFKNMIMGVLQAFLRYFSYKIALYFLLFTEILFLILFIFTLKTKIYKILFKFWLFIILNFSKIILIFTFSCSYNNDISSFID